MNIIFSQSDTLCADSLAGANLSSCILNIIISEFTIIRSVIARGIFDGYFIGEREAKSGSDRERVRESELIS